MKKVRFLLVAVLLAAALPAWSGQWKPYNEAQFQKDQKEGKTVVLDFYADWCPVCKKQGKALSVAFQDKRLLDVVGYIVDYDKSDALQKQLDVLSQSTLIVFKGDQEAGRAVGVTDLGKIKELVQQGL